MPIFFGNSTKNKKDIIIDGVPMQKVYVGDKLVWQKLNPCLASLPNNLIAYYKMEETSGNIIDSKNGYNLAVFGGVTRGQAGKLGNAIYFSGAAGEYCSGNTPLNGKTSWTISMWVKLNRSQTSPQGILGGTSTFPAWSPTINQQGNTVINNGWCDSALNFTASDGINRNIGEWYLVTQRGHLDVLNDKLYYKYSINDNHLEYSFQNGAGFSSIAGTLVLGRHAYQTTQAFQGWVDDIKIWDRELTDCEILANYNSGNGVVI